MLYVIIISHLFCLSLSLSIRVDVCVEVSGVGIPDSVGKKLLLLGGVGRVGGGRKDWRDGE